MSPVNANIPGANLVLAITLVLVCAVIVFAVLPS